MKKIKGIFADAKAVEYVEIKPGDRFVHASDAEGDDYGYIMMMVDDGQITYVDRANDSNCTIGEVFEPPHYWDKDNRFYVFDKKGLPLKIRGK